MDRKIYQSLFGKKRCFFCIALWDSWGGAVPLRFMHYSEQHYLDIFRILKEQPQINQRTLSQRLRISLGKANYCLNALIDKGWVKAVNFKNSKNKLAYRYMLTPSGIEAKTRLTFEYLRKKNQEYEELKKTIASLQEEISQ